MKGSLLMHTTGSEPTPATPSGIDAWLPAWIFAAEAHAQQTMPGSKRPYLQHLGHVTMEVLQAHAHQAVPDLNLALMCAALHDAIEDQGVSHAVLAQKFGPAVADGVLALSKRGDLPKTEAMADSLARIRMQPVSVWCVKLADRVSNLSSPPPAHWSSEKALAYAREGETILAALGEAHVYLAARLRQKIDSYPLQSMAPVAL